MLTHDNKSVQQSSRRETNFWTFGSTVMLLTRRSFRPNKHVYKTRAASNHSNHNSRGRAPFSTAASRQPPNAIGYCGTNIFQPKDWVESARAAIKSCEGLVESLKSPSLTPVQVWKNHPPRIAIIKNYYCHHPSRLSEFAPWLTIWLVFVVVDLDHSTIR